MLLFMACEITDCRGGFGPDPIPPDPNGTNGEPKDYDLEVTYIRTEILNSSWVTGPIAPVLYLITKAGSKRITYIALDQKTDYKFTGEFPNISSNGSETYYVFHTVDMARYDGSDMGSAVVGDRFIIKVKQTNFQTELKNIRRNGLQSNPYPTEKAKMPCFILTKEGTIISDAQNSNW